MKVLKISSYISLCLNITLLFFLIFESKLQVPLWFSPVGRFHTLILHLPIGVAVVLGLFFILRNVLKLSDFEKVSQILFSLLALTSVLAAFCGLILAQEAGYERTNTLDLHKYTGVAFGVICYVLAELQTNIIANERLKYIVAATLMGFVIIVGHFGGSLTHGDNFLLENLNPQTRSNEITIYKAKIEPIFKTKCMQCHNDKKSKGELNMTDVIKIMKGGKNGAIWVANDTIKSHIIQRMNLPFEHKEHMPPKGKTQLTYDEIVTITKWIAEGAEMKRKLADVSKSSFFYASNLISEIKYEFEEADKSTIEKINSPFCMVKPIATGSPALKVHFFVASRFNYDKFLELQKISKQVVSLNMSKMPVNDDVFKNISEFVNLESLILNGTNITGIGIENLLKCKKLKRLALSNTKINLNNLSKIANHRSITNLYIWNTEITENQLNEWGNKKLNIELGYINDDNDLIKLNPPILINEKTLLKEGEKITFKHTLHGADIRYTLDGTKPDSVNSKIYTEPIAINDFTKIKVMATKKLWYASNVLDYSFFMSKYIAQNYELIKLPNPKYNPKKKDLLIDQAQSNINTFRAGDWLGYRENELEVIFSFDKPTTLSGLTLSYGINITSYVFSPMWVAVYYQDLKGKWTLVEKRNIEPNERDEVNVVKGFDVKMKNITTQKVKVIAMPLTKIPSWHEGKGQPAWFFTDEVYFY